MRDSLLRKRVDKSIRVLSPLFKLTSEEKFNLKKLKIRRIFKPREHPDFRGTPAYSSLDNFVYFPRRNPSWAGPQSVFSELTINHEVGHYLHAAVNLEIREITERLEHNGEKYPEGYEARNELTAEYPNFILGLDIMRDGSYDEVSKPMKRLFQKYGPEFLPELARMSIKEIMSKKLLPKSYIQEMS